MARPAKPSERRFSEEQIKLNIAEETLLGIAAINLAIISKKVSGKFRGDLNAGFEIIGAGELHFHRPLAFDGAFEVEDEASKKVEINGNILFDLYIDALTQLIGTFTAKYVDYSSVMPKMRRDGRNFKITDVTPPFIQACLRSDAMIVPVAVFQEKLSRHVNEIRTAEEARAERHQASEAKRERQLKNRRREAEAAEKEWPKKQHYEHNKLASKKSKKRQKQE